MCEIYMNSLCNHCVNITMKYIMPFTTVKIDSFQENLEIFLVLGCCVVCWRSG